MLKKPSVDWRTAETYSYALAHVCGEPGRKLDRRRLKMAAGDLLRQLPSRARMFRGWVNAQLEFGYSPRHDSEGGFACSVNDGDRTTDGPIQRSGSVCLSGRIAASNMLERDEQLMRVPSRR